MQKPEKDQTYRISEAVATLFLLKTRDNLDKQFIAFVVDPHSNSSKKFVSDFINDLHQINIEPDGLIPDIFPPTTFGHYIVLLGNLSYIIPKLSEFDLNQEMNILLEFTCDRLLPYLRNATATVCVKKKEKVTELYLERFKGHKTAAFMLTLRASILAKSNTDEAQIMLNDAQALRHQADIHEDDNNELLEREFTTRKKIYKKDYNQNRSKWTAALKTIEINNDENQLGNAIDMVHYLTRAQISLNQNSPDFALAECYCDLAANFFSRIKINGKRADEVMSPTKIAKFLLEIADQHKAAGRMNSAIRCYEKSKQFHEKYRDQLRQNKVAILTLGFPASFLHDEVRKSLEQIANIDRSVGTIQRDVFFAYTRAWNEISLPESIKIEFKEQGCAMTLVFTDRALYKICAQQLKQLPLFSEPLLSDREPHQNSITLLNVHHLTTTQITQALARAQKKLQVDKLKSQKRIEERAAAIARQETALAPQVQTQSSGDSTSYENSTHDPSKDLFPAPKTVKSATSNKQPAAVPRTPINRTQHIQIDWTEDLPDYINTKDVTPIPDKDVLNSSIPKGIFYGYIDHELLDRGVIDDKKLSKFNDVLSRGKIAADGDSQGIRPVSGELGPESDYLFKLNAHAEDYRLYGRCVAKKILPNGQMIMLIAFDQAVPHDKTLDLSKTSPSNLISNNQ